MRSKVLIFSLGGFLSNYFCSRNLIMGSLILLTLDDVNNIYIELYSPGRVNSIIFLLEMTAL